jgi:hypothetical protein
MYNLNTMQRAVVLGAASLALTASPALAQPDYPATHVTQSAPGQAASSIDLRSPDAQDATHGPSIDLRSPDATDASSGPVRLTSSLAGTTSASPRHLRSPDATDASSGPFRATSSLAGTTSASPRVAAAVQPAKADDDIDWSSVAIGAGAILGVMLVGVGGVAMTHRTRIHATR